MVSNRALIVMLALKTHLPTTFATGDSARAGGSWLTDRTSWLCSGVPPSMSTRFLRGTSPGDLPVE